MTLLCGLGVGITWRTGLEFKIGSTGGQIKSSINLKEHLSDLGKTCPVDGSKYPCVPSVQGQASVLRRGNP